MSKLRSASKIQLAVNLYDLTRVDPLIKQVFLAGKLDTDPARLVRVNPKRLDETGVLFVCDLLVAACACDTLRDHDRKVGAYPTRVYLRKGKTWRRLPAAMMLTSIREGQPILNPSIFVSKVSGTVPDACRIVL